VWGEALIYLGEIRYVEGDRAAADATFRLLLERDPGWRISPYEHPMDVVGAFEIVRASVQGENSQRKTDRPIGPPLPWWGYAPLGVPQFKQGRIGAGAAFATVQLGLAATSVASWVWIDRLRPDRDADLDDATLQATQRARLIRGALNVPSAVAFYAVWGGSVLDAGLTHRREATKVEVGWTIAPEPGGASVVVGGRF
jgi:hypothetical protein